MNKSSVLTTTFCRSCKRLRSCLDTKRISNYSFLCKECARNQDLVIECIECGRESTTDILKHGCYCHLCERDNISECSLCGKEEYNNKLIDGVCTRCIEGTNKPCIKCGEYFHKDKLTSDNLCSKCSIKLHKRLRESNINEVVECIECGREVFVNDTKDGLCIYCYSQELEKQIKKLKPKRKYYKY